MMELPLLDNDITVNGGKFKSDPKRTMFSVVPGLKSQCIAELNEHNSRVKP